MSDLRSKLESIRTDARDHLDQGAVTDTYGTDAEQVVAVLNDVLATELVCVLRYKRHYYMAQGLFAGPVAQEFLEHANEEMQHADLVAARIVQLQGEPDLNPRTLLERSHSEYVPGIDLVDMIKENLVAERIAVATYQEIIRWLGDKDPTTRRVIESILANEEEHAEDLASLLHKVSDQP